MKRLFFSTIALILIFNSCTGGKPKASSCKDKNCCTKSDTVVCCSKEKAEFGKVRLFPKNDIVEILSFHTSQRCKTCKTIEKLTKEVAEKHFKNELDSGKLRMSVIDITSPGGETLANSYNVTLSSLFLNKWENGEENRIDMTDIGFSKALNSPSEFKTALRDNLNNLLS